MNPLLQLKKNALQHVFFTKHLICSWCQIPLTIDKLRGLSNIKGGNDLDPVATKYVFS